MGAGSDTFINLQLFVEPAVTKLVIMSPELFHMHGINRRMVELIRVRQAYIPERLERKQLPVDFRNADNCTTDGSFSSFGNVSEHLAHKLDRKCGAAIVLQDNDGSRFSGAVYIKCNSNLHEYAQSVETVALLGAISVDSSLKINSDCKGAIGQVRRFSCGRGYVTPLRWLMSGVRGKGDQLHWVKSHPERAHKIDDFDSQQAAIYAADLLAGGDIDGFCSYSGVARADVQMVSDEDIYQHYADKSLFQLWHKGAPLTQLSHQLEASRRFKDYQIKRPSYMGCSTPWFAGKVQKRHASEKKSLTGRRGRVQDSKIVWKWFWDGEKAARFGPRLADEDAEERGICPHCKFEVETQRHTICECTGGSMHSIRVCAYNAARSMVVKASKRQFEFAAILGEVCEMAISHSQGHELWTGMLSETMRSRLEDLTSTVRDHVKAKVCHNAMVNLCRIFRLACSDLYTERSRLVGVAVKPPRGPSQRGIPTVPTDYLQFLKRKKKEGATKPDVPPEDSLTVRLEGVTLNRRTRIISDTGPTVGRSKGKQRTTKPKAQTRKDCLVDTQESREVHRTPTGIESWLGHEATGRLVKTKNKGSGKTALSTAASTCVASVAPVSLASSLHLHGFYMSSRRMGESGGDDTLTPGARGNRSGIGT